MEVWKDVVGYEGLYQVSDRGNVKNQNNMLLSGNIQDGYRRVGLTKYSKLKVIRVHILVAKAFLKKEDHHDRINHIDLNRSNNHVSNLEWCTAKENSQHAKNHGRIPSGEDCKQSKISDQVASEIYESDKSAKELSSIYNIPKSIINHIRSTKGRSQLGNNAKTPKIGKTSQVGMPMGVSKRVSKEGKESYYARLNINRKSKHLGTFNSEDEAFACVSSEFFAIYGFYPDKYEHNVKRIRQLTL